MNPTDAESNSSDAAAVPSGAIHGERHVSEVAGPAERRSKRTGIGVIVAGTLLVCGVIVLQSQQPNLKVEPGPQLTNQPVVRYEPPPPPTPVPPAMLPLPTQALPPPPPSTPLAPDVRSPAPQARPPRLLVYTSGGQNPPAGSGTSRFAAGGLPDGPSVLAGAPEPTNGLPVQARGLSGGFPGTSAVADGSEGSRPGQDDNLQARLTPTRLTSVAANVLRHQPYLLTMGTIIPCVLQTALDSTLPGFVTCMIPEDVQGKTGLTLLDRGTRIVGEFRGGVRQGLERLFVVWTRAETPQGVVIHLDSPATDPLGRAGLEGEIDRHFWQRFGGALLMTTVDGAIQAGIASASKSGTTTINTGQTQGVIAEMLRGTINIPPTIRKNQGELVSIFVARDLDFSTVYQIRAVATSPITERERSIP